MPSVQFIKSNETKDNSINFKSIVIGGVTGILISLLLLCLFAFLILTLKISTDYISALAKTALVSGAFLSGAISAKNKNKSGWLYGLLSGFVYFLLLMLFGVILKVDQTFDFSKLVTLLLCAVFSALGGILGINMKSKNKKRKKH